MAEDPLECCGLLAGRDGRVTKLYRTTNTAASPTRYFMDPRELLTIFKELDDIFINAKKSVIYKTVVETVEKPLIEKALERTFGNQLKAAKILGIHRNTLKAKISKFGIRPEKWKI